MRRKPGAWTWVSFSNEENVDQSTGKPWSPIGGSRFSLDSVWISYLLLGSVVRGITVQEIARSNRLFQRGNGDSYRRYWNRLALEDNSLSLVYNYFRDYDFPTGRHIESDPIGLDGELNLFAYLVNNRVNANDPLGLATYSIGIGGSFQQTAAGASASGSIGFDSSGQASMQFTSCGRIGPGESAGVTVDFTFEEGDFCEGNSASGGVFAEGGAGLFGGGCVDYGTSGASATGGFNIGIGGGAAVGS